MNLCLLSLWLLFILVFLASCEQQHHNNHGSHHGFPLISVSLNYDPTNYLSKLIASIDYPVKRFVVQIGNTHANITKEIAQQVSVAVSSNPLIRHSHIVELTHNPGAAKGFNFGIDSMQSNNESFVLILNYDIEFYPGVLKRLHHDVQQVYHHNHTFGLGMTALCCGGAWSAIVVTKRLVDEIGHFDENFYPGYFEDDDYAIRVHLSKYEAHKFADIHLKHRGFNGTVLYYSGIWDALNKIPSATEDLKQSKESWRQAFKVGEGEAKSYIHKKWGLRFYSDDEKKTNDCKTVDKMNHGCVVQYRSPFNASHPLSYWTLESSVRDRMSKD